MSNFLRDIKAVIDTDTIEAVNLGGKLATIVWPETSDPREAPDSYHGRLISWEEAQEVLNYEYDSGYGHMDCHDVTIWGKEYIYYIHEYDGSTCVHCMSRNPKV